MAVKVPLVGRVLLRERAVQCGPWGPVTSSNGGLGAKWGTEHRYERKPMRSLQMIAPGLRINEAGSEQDKRLKAIVSGPPRVVCARLESMHLAARMNGCNCVRSSPPAMGGTP